MDSEPSGAPRHQYDPSAFLIEVFGVRWTLSFHGLTPEVVESLTHLWSRARVEPDPSREAPSLPILADLEDRPEGIAEADVIIVGTSAPEIPYNLSRSITLRCITRRSGEALMLHAVGVCGEDGRTVALVAPSGTGKTTAAKTLGQRLGYVTDETVVIEPDGRISPYPKPLSIIGDAERPYEKGEHAPDDLGLQVPAADPHLAAVVIIRRDPDLEGPEFTPEPLVEAILEVIPETSALPSMPDPLDHLCRALTQSGGPFKLRYAEIEDCTDLVLDLTRPDPERDADHAIWEHVPGEERSLPGGSSPKTVDWSSELTRCTWSDAIISTGEAVLLQEGLPLRLSPLGTLLWLHADAPTTIQELHDQIVETIGPHPRAASLVMEATQLLVDAKILAVVPPSEEP